MKSKNSRFRFSFGMALMLLAAYVSTSFEIKEIEFEEDVCALSNESFINGETIVYKIYYNWGLIWIPAGEAKFVLRETESEYITDVIGATYSSYDEVFKVRDRYRSHIDKETLLPNAFVREISQGNYERYDSMLFDQKALKVREFYGKSKSSAKERNFDLNQCTQDLVSVLYHLRNRDITNVQAGSKLPVSFFFSKRLYELDVDIIELERKKIKELGKYEVIKARPELITGSIFDEDSYMDVWVSNDQNKLPLLIESPLSVGKVKAVLKSYDNLRYPLVEN